MKNGILIIDENGKRREIHLPQQHEITIGRSSNALIQLNDMSVSRAHAVIERRPDGFLLMDRDSRNGTRVNGVAIVRRLLQDGDHVAFGSISMQFFETDETPPRHKPLPKSESLPKETAEARTRIGLPVPEDSPSEAENWSVVNSWQILRSFNSCRQVGLEKILRKIVDDLAGLSALRRVVLYLEGGVLEDSPRWLKSGATRSRPGLIFPDEKMIEVANTGTPIGLQDSRFVAAKGDQPFEALCYPIAIDGRASGYIYFEGEESLPPGVINITCRSIVEAINLALTIYGKNTNPETISTPPTPRRTTAAKTESSPVIVGRSNLLQQAVRLAEKAAQSDATVLIRGETGTGKELFTRLIFEESRRCDGPFVPVHCSAIEETLMSSALFGHEKGAFTGAVTQKKGLFEEADQGTIFLDEIGELSPATQVKMLRILQEGEFMRVGGNKPIRVKVRVVAATNRDLETAVQKGEFREDLYFRLKVIEIKLPALRQRPDDIPELIHHYVREISQQLTTPVKSISDEAMTAFQNYRWPGNIRELRNVIERSLVLAERSVLTLDDLPPEIANPPVPSL